MTYIIMIDAETVLESNLLDYDACVVSVALTTSHLQLGEVTWQ